VENYLLSFARSLVYLLEGFALLWLAKIAYTQLYRRVDWRAELFERNNHALAVAACGYLFAICIALGGVLSGESESIHWWEDLVDITLYGVATIVLMLVAGFLCEKVLLPHFNNTKEIIEDHNLGTAFVEAGMHIANGLIVLAIIQGSGPWWSGLVFWALAQGVLLLAGRLYEAVTAHSIHAELERNNAAVGLAFAGVLIGLGNIISVAVAGDFVSWRESLTFFATDALFGLLVLLLIKKLTDYLLAPGVKLGAEQIGEQPNIGAGLLEAFGYLGGSMLVIWVF
jgi:uncharacterized membrane protein YjfL (UPF0719 family)